MTDALALPINTDAEMSLIGAVLADNSVYWRAAEKHVRYEHFSDPALGRIWQIIVDLMENGRKADPITVADSCPDDAPGKITIAYLSELAAAVPAPVNAPDYAHTVRELGQRRAFILEATDAIERVRYGGPGLPLAELYNGLSEVMDDAAEDDTRPIRPIGDVVEESLARAIAVRDHKAPAGVPTGIRSLDEAIGGLRPGEVLVLAGRPGMGKSACATTIAINAAAAGYRTILFSQEMSDLELGARALAMRSGVSASRQLRGKFGASDEADMLEAARGLAGLPLHLDDTALASVPHIGRRIRRVQAQGPVGLVVVDYLQLLVSERKSDNRVAEVSYLTRSIKTLAKTVGVPIILISQLSRAVEARDDKRPTLPDLRESGSIEQDADAVIFVYRQAYYLERQKPQRKPGETPDAHQGRVADWHAEVDKIRYKAELIVAKQRNGPIDTVECRFDGARGLFSDWQEGAAAEPMRDEPPSDLWPEGRP